ncbi:MAG: DUF4159 domain-containing protein [Acidobacteriota bacterium]
MKRFVLTVLVLAIWGSLSPAWSDVDSSRDPNDPNLFQFVRIRYHDYGGAFGSMRWGNGPPWMHDYPRAERNFLKILLEVTSIETTPESFLILDMEDPRIMEYPFLYVSEPGYWNVTSKEAVNLREYFRRGGFVLFDDFRGQDDWNNLVSAMKQVLPDRSFRRLTLESPVFQCFYNIESLDVVPPYAVPGQPAFYGLGDDQGRLQAVANLNNDIGEYWEWSDESINPISFTNEAYKFGINYVIYSLTH